MNSAFLLPLVGSMMASHTPPTSVALDTPSPSAAPKPVLLVIANRDFYYQEYADTRRSIEAAGLKVRVAAADASRCVPTPGTGQPTRLFGGVMPELTLAKADASDYSAIVFVGGWGASMYQYAYNDPNLDGTIDSYYANPAYNGGDLTNGDGGETKEVVNQLINVFVDQDKFVAAICHGVSVLAWARVDGVSPLQGRKVAATLSGSPAGNYLGRWYPDNELSTHVHIVANGGFTNPYSGQYADPTTAADDVVVDGRIITAENFTSAPQFGRVIVSEILKTKK